MNMLPLKVFPGFTTRGVVDPQVQELAVTFNTEGLQALTESADEEVAWADIGTRVSAGMFEVKIPIRLPSSMAFKPFEGQRSYNSLHIAAPTIEPQPWDLNFEWDAAINQATGNLVLKQAFGVEGLGTEVVQAARSHKAQLVASLIYEGFTNAALGVTAKALTIPQPDAPNGLPLFTDGSTTPMHYSHPFKKTSGRFANLFLGAGKLTDAFGTMVSNMQKVPHPTLPNRTMGNRVTDIVGPSHMMDPFHEISIQRLALQISGASFGATTNKYSVEALKAAQADGQFLGAAGLSPYRYWIAPQLDDHPYVKANPGKHMWMSICAKRPSQCWAELAAPNRDFVPTTTLFGDADPQSRRTRKVSMITDMDAGAAAGLPHFAQLYFETTPS